MAYQQTVVGMKCHPSESDPRRRYKRKPCGLLRKLPNERNIGFNSNFIEGKYRKRFLKSKRRKNLVYVTSSTSLTYAERMCSTDAWNCPIHDTPDDYLKTIYFRISIHVCLFTFFVRVLVLYSTTTILFRTSGSMLPRFTTELNTGTDFVIDCDDWRASRISNITFSWAILFARPGIPHLLV